MYSQTLAKWFDYALDILHGIYNKSCDVSCIHDHNGIWFLSGISDCALAHPSA